MKDINGGYWGLAIILSAFMIQVISFGIGFSIGIYNIEFLEYYTNDALAVSLVSAINLGCFLGSGPIVSFLMTKISHRSIVLVGAALSFVSMIIVPFLPSLPYLYVVYGVVTGFGFCCVYVPSHVMSGLYFDKHRSLATGVATSGSGLGTVLLPTVTALLIEEYTWKGSMLILAGLCSNLFVFGALLRPLPKTIKNKPDESETMLDQTISKNSRKPLRHIFIFCDFGFDVYFVNNVMWNMSSAMVLAFGPEYFTTKGLSKIDAAFMLTMSGIGTFLGAIVGGIVGNIPCFNRIAVLSVATFTLGIFISMLPVFPDYAGILGLCISLGFAFGVILGLLVVVTTDFLGPESLGDGLGYLMLANGIGLFGGPPLAGYLRERSGSYTSSMYVAGALAIFGGLVMVLIPLKKKIMRKEMKIQEAEIDLTPMETTEEPPSIS